MDLQVVMDNPDAMVCLVTSVDKVPMVNQECKGNKVQLVLLVKTADPDGTDQKVQLVPKVILEDVEIVVNKDEMDRREEQAHPVSADSLDHQEHLVQMFELSLVLLKTWFTSFVTNYYKLKKIGAREQNQL